MNTLGDVQEIIMSVKSCLVIGVVLAGLSVVMGAFGAHSLESQLKHLEPAEFARKLENWKTGAMYQFFHSLGIISIGMVMTLDTGQRRWLHVAVFLMLAGIMLFSGSLYLMTLTGLRLGMIVPIGGLAFILGWGAFALGTLGLKLRTESLS
jgi:uncharacterized membrane protein YgdD (TMEM256/DUF423 family)